MPESAYALHRYRAFHREFLYSEIVRGEVYLWRLDEQNDPLEGRISYNQEISRARIRESLAAARELIRSDPSRSLDKQWLFGPELGPYAALLRTHLRGATDEALDELTSVLHASGNFSNEKVIGDIRSGHARMLSRTVIACFSKNPESPVMFAHYAKAHTGVCLTYEVDCRDLFPVRYQVDVPRLDLLEGNREEVARARLCTKHSDWAYEREYRLVLYDRDPGLYSHERIRLTDISLGFLAPEAVEADIKMMVKDSRFAGLAVWRLRPAAHSYGFDRVQIA